MSDKSEILAMIFKEYGMYKDVRDTMICTLLRKISKLFCLLHKKGGAEEQ